MLDNNKKSFNQFLAEESFEAEHGFSIAQKKIALKLVSPMDKIRYIFADARIGATISAKSIQEQLHLSKSMVYVYLGRAANEGLGVEKISAGRYKKVASIK